MDILRPPPPDLPTYAQLCPSEQEYRWSESNEDWICGICPASKVANQGHLEGEMHLNRLMQWGHRFPHGRAVYERRDAQLAVWRATGQPIALVGPPPPSLAAVPGPPPPGPPPGPRAANAVPPSPPWDHAAFEARLLDEVREMRQAMTQSMARLSDEVRDMRQAIDSSTQQVKQQILDIKTQIIAAARPPGVRPADGGAAAAPWSWPAGGAADGGSDDSWQRGAVADVGADATWQLAIYDGGAGATWQGGAAADGGAYDSGAAAASEEWTPW